MSIGRILSREWLPWLDALVLVLVSMTIATLNLDGDRQRVSRREATTVGRLRDIVHEQGEFRSRHGCFAGDISQFADITERDHYYSFALLPETGGGAGCLTKYLVTASPISPELKGSRYFAMDETEILRLERTHPSGRNSPVLQ
jgi:hypothetical protein